MYMKFRDKDNDEVYLTYKSNKDVADGQHVLIIPIYKHRLLFTQHKVRGIEFPGGKKELGETSETAAERELFEETGASIKQSEYIAQYRVVRQNGYNFTKDVFVVEVNEILQKEHYFETNGPLLYKHTDQIAETKKSFLLQDAAILHCLERVRELGFYQ